MLARKNNGGRMETKYYNTIEVLEDTAKKLKKEVLKDALLDAIDTLKAVESAGDMLWKEPGKVTWDKDDFTAECEFKGFSKGVDWMKPILAKQILKVEELEAKIKDIENG